MAKSKRKNKSKIKPAKIRRIAKKTRVKVRSRRPLKARKLAAKKPATKKIAVKKAKVAPIGGLPGELHAIAMKILRERQAEEIVSINLAGRSSMADYLIIASGRASRQIAAIADHLRKAFEELGVRRIRIEGLPQGNWVLVDAGDIVVHLFRPEVRRFYAFDEIWDK